MHELYRRAQAGDHAATTRLLEIHEPLVKFIVVYRVGFLHGGRDDFDNLMSYGKVALYGAIMRYDYTRGIKFSTFAYRRIRGEIIRERRRERGFPTRWNIKLKTQAGRPKPGKDESEDWTERIADPVAVACSDLECGEVRNLNAGAVAKLLAVLDERELDIIARHLGLGDYEPEDNKEIGSAHLLTNERVRQIIEAATIKMQGAAWANREQLASAADMPDEELDAANLKYRVRQGEVLNYFDFVVTDMPPRFRGVATNHAALIEELLSKLGPTRRRVLELYNGYPDHIPRNLTQIAQMTDTNNMNTSQAKKNALAQLRLLLSEDIERYAPLLDFSR